MLAGASSDYYTELEQGGAQPSEQMLAALARALRLTGDERDHIYRLADRALPIPGGPASHVEPTMLSLLDRLADTPAQIVTDLHVTLAQNSVAETVFGPPVAAKGLEASCVYRWFTDLRSREVFPEDDHDYHSRAYVADLRAASGRRDDGDPETARLVTELEQHSDEFAHLWGQHEVAVRRNERKRIVHPAVGILELNCLNLFSEDNRQRLIWLTPVDGTDAAEKLGLLTVLGN